MRMCNLYIQMNDLVTGYWFTGDLDTRVNEALVKNSILKKNFWKWLKFKSLLKNITEKITAPNKLYSYIETKLPKNVAQGYF